MVTDEMVEKALSSFNKTINEPIMVKCQRCDGRGYHHGFGEDGHDPDWCVECGGNQYDVAPGEESRAMRAALEAALSAQGQETNCAKCGMKKHTPLRVDRMGGYVCLTCIDTALSAQVQDAAAKSLADAYQKYLDASHLYNERLAISKTKALGTMRVDEEYRAIDEARRAFDKLAVDIAKSALPAAPAKQEG